MPDETLGIDDVARLCRVTVETVRRWLSRDKLPAVTGGGAEPRISPADLIAFLSSHGLWAPPQLRPETGPCVLVVDDEPDMRGLVVRVLQRLAPSVRVHQAADGFEAGQKVMTLTPDVVVLDLHLPGLEGTRVCHNIRACAGFKRMRVLAISGDKDPALREAALREGADSFLLKPFYPRDLEVMLEALLAGR